MYIYLGGISSGIQSTEEVPLQNDHEDQNEYFEDISSDILLLHVNSFG